MKNNQGLTLIELIVYIGLTAVILTSVVMIAANLLQDSVKADLISRVTGESSLIQDKIVYYVNRASGFDGATSYSSPGTIAVVYNGVVVKFDTYLKTVMMNNRSISVRKLRFQSGAGPAVDLTSDDVTVTTFSVENYSGTGVGSARVTLQLNSVNPDNTNLYNNQYVSTFGATIRK
jgi:hypothetical protein